MNNKIRISGQNYILGYCVLGAAIDVLLSDLLQSINLFVLLYWTFTFTWLGFVLVTISFFPVKFSVIYKHFKLILLLNISTLGSWIGLFIGLKWTEPSIMVAIIFGLRPIIAFLIEIYNKNVVARKNIIIMVLLTFIVAILMLLAVKNKRFDPFDSDLIFILTLSIVCLVTSVCLVKGTYIAKKLSNKEFTAANVQSFRFPLLISVCYLLLPNEGILTTVQSSFWGFLPIIVILGNMLPLWMLQKGIELTNALTINIIVNITPCITLLLELFDPSIAFSSVKLLVLVMLLVVLLIANDDTYNFITKKMRRI